MPTVQAMARHARALPMLRAAAMALAAVLGCAPAQGEGLLDATLLGQIRAWVGLVHGSVPGLVQAGAQGRLRLEVEPGRLDPRLRLAPCRRVEPRWPDQAAPGQPLRVALRCVDGDKPWQVWLPIQVRLFAPAVVILRPLPAGTVISAADLQLADADWAAQPRMPFARIDELVGRTLARPLAAGHALRATDLRERQWFASGEAVQLLARGAGFTVAGEAQALGPGIEGRPVRVRTEAGRVLQGMPVGERRVEMLL